jgi:hypothetical protein
MEELVDAACKNMMSAEVSSPGNSRHGYCILFFNSPIFEAPQDGDKWFISNITPMQGIPGGPERSCELPPDPVEPATKEMLSLGGAYFNSETQAPGGSEHWRPTQFYNQSSSKAWDPDTLVFSLDPVGVCTVYSYSGFSRVVTVRRDGEFVPVGTIYNDQGIIQALKSTN